MSRQSCPRPILKCSPQQVATDPRASSSSHHHHGSVRFPSSPKLSTVHLTHCAKSYDRSPIIVGPNTCALPERGCRSYAPQGQGNHLHPSAFNRDGSQFYDGSPFPPPLTHDDGSSEDSDGIASPPPEVDQHHAQSAYHRQYVPSQAHLYSEPLSHPPISRPAPSFDDAPSEYSLSFLPHASPMVSCGRKKPRSYYHRIPSMEVPTSSWQSDEASCLGGF